MIPPGDAAARPPIAIDLDGTLTPCDTLHEGLADYVKAPVQAAALVRAMLRGRAELKRAIARSVRFDAALLPYNQALLDWLRAERASGRRIGLFTAADQSIADAVAAHLGLFDVVCGSDGITNLSGAAKADAIAAAFGPAFAYAGDGAVDLPIFARAASVVLVGPTGRLRGQLAPGTAVEAAFPAVRPGLGVWSRALRPRHWSKNALVFVAPILGVQPLAAAVPALLLFVLMSVLASATYVLNDLADLSADRLHPDKRRRPFAAGDIPARDGASVAAAMVVGALVASLILPAGCSWVLLAYLMLTLLYSVTLKRVPMVDVTVLAGLFTLRVLAGMMLVATPVSPWLLTFAMLFFLGLAMVKRYAELRRLADGAMARGYSREDMPVLLATGIATGISAIVIFMVYLINDQYPRAVYAYPAALWGIMPVLLVWTLRIWHLSVHGRMSEDPVVFALRDRVSLLLGVAVLGIIGFARL